ncbi:hypothetical protein BVRB_2g035210 [Beta vulgaris subsp. vulgaris]|nr:hypothetical protein BVRB_2g035210 [Beta vulgaris subsp. vulgaris]
MIVEQIREYLKGDEIAVKNYLSKCMYYSGIGNNDYLNNYFMAWRYPTSSIYTPQEYAVDLLQAYKLQLTALYDLGARKVIVPNIGQMGCIPIRRVKNGTQESLCNEDDNYVVKLFNSGLRDLVDTFNNARLPGAKFVYVDFFQGCKDLHSNRTYFGFEVVDKGCCGVGENTNGGEITCLPLQTPCKDRTKYLFWDAFHPSELVHMVVVIAGLCTAVLVVADGGDGGDGCWG